MVRALPWAIAAVLAVAVWHDHARSNLPWLLLAATTYAAGWAQGRRRPRRTPRVERPILRVITARPMRALHMEVERPPEVVAEVVSALVGLGWSKPRAKDAAEQAISVVGSGASTEALLRKALSEGARSLAVRS